MLFEAVGGRVTRRRNRLALMATVAVLALVLLPEVTNRPCPADRADMERIAGSISTWRTGWWSGVEGRRWMGRVARVGCLVVNGSGCIRSSNNESKLGNSSLEPHT